MVNTDRRMSPLTALFLGVFGTASFGIAAGTGVVIYVLSVVHEKSDAIVDLARDAIVGLPGFLEALPPEIGDRLGESAPEYAEYIEVEVRFVAGGRYNRPRPALTIRNTGDRQIQWLTMRIAALNENNIPVGEWTEVVATPIGFENELPGPMRPGATRYKVLGGWYRSDNELVEVDLKSAVEITEVRVWPREANGSRKVEAEIDTDQVLAEKN